MQKRSVVYLELLAHGVKLLPGFYVGLFMKQTIDRKKNTPSLKWSHTMPCSIYNTTVSLVCSSSSPCFRIISHNHSGSLWGTRTCWYSRNWHVWLYTYWHQVFILWNPGWHHCNGTIISSVRYFFTLASNWQHFLQIHVYHFQCVGQWRKN